MKKMYMVLFLVGWIASSCGDIVIYKVETPLITGWFPSMSDVSFDYSGRPLKTGWYHVVDSGKGVVIEQGENSTYYLDPEPIVTASDFKTMSVESFPHDSTRWQVVVHLDERGRELFAKATEEHIGKDLAFVLDDSLWDEPVRIQGKIPNGVIVINKKGRFSKEEAEGLKRKIEVTKDELTR